VGTFAQERPDPALATIPERVYLCRVITPEDVAQVPLFAELDESQRDQLCRMAADVSLLAGEYAAHEGDERALFALLSGQVEARRVIDGSERVLGVRNPGDLFGEVPITLGTVFPVSFRAVEPSRVIKIEPADYHALASGIPQISEAVGKLAAHRMGGTRGLSGIAAAPPPPRARVLGQRWDASCANLRRFLDRNQVSFRWLTPDVPNAEEHWGGPLPPEEDWPAVQVIGGKTVIKPQLRRIAELLELGTEPESADYDVVVVGAGPSGLAAGVYGASEGLKTLVVEREAPGGQAGTSSRIENYLGFPSGLSGDELASRALQQARRLGAEILVTRAITRIDAATRHVHLDGGDVLRAKTIILACGVSWRQLDIEGFDRLAGKGIFYGAARSEASNTHGLDVHIIGAGNSAGQAALFFSTHARSVTIMCRGEGLARSMSRYLIDQIAARPNIRTRTYTQVIAAHGEVSLEALDIQNSQTGDVRRLESGGLFIFIGADAETEWMPDEIVKDERGFVLTGPELRANGEWPLERDPYLLETSVPGIFACGDVRYGPVKRVAAAVGEGSMAIAFVHQYLRDPALERV
jgi:thioredoxin reductase (NADPH)